MAFTHVLHLMLSSWKLATVQLSLTGLPNQSISAIESVVAHSKFLSLDSQAIRKQFTQKMEHHCPEDDCTQIYVHQKELSAVRDRDSLVFLHEKCFPGGQCRCMANEPSSQPQSQAIFIFDVLRGGLGTRLYLPAAQTLQPKLGESAPTDLPFCAIPCAFMHKELFQIMQ